MGWWGQIMHGEGGIYRNPASGHLLPKHHHTEPIRLAYKLKSTKRESQRKVRELDLFPLLEHESNDITLSKIPPDCSH